MRKCLPLLASLPLLVGCATEVLTVHMDYISHENLASTYVGTPDPLLESALVGQRLIVSWWLPLNYNECCGYELRIRLRYGTREEAETIVPFQKRVGWYVYTLTNEEFFEKKGVKTYCVQLYAAGKLVDEWQHQLWVPLVEFPQEITGEEVNFDEEEDEEDTRVDVNTSNDDEVQVLD